MQASFGSISISKRKIFAITAVIIIAGTSIYATLPWSNTTRRQLGKEIVKCPQGHRGIRLVPVVAGLLRMDEDFEERLARREFVIGGGCVITPDIPAYHGFCDRCRYEYEIPATAQRESIIPLRETSAEVSPFT